MSELSYRSDIDGLRGVAVLSVVAYHVFPTLVRGGFIGVDIFFVISGYLISTIIFESLHQDTFSFIDFYGRRIRRIFPALIVVLTASFAFGWFALLADEYKQLGKHIAGGAGFISNFLFWEESDYFDNVAETKPLLHLWTLGIEEQYYIVWPLILWLAWKRSLNPLRIAIAVAVISFALNIAQTYGDSAAAFYFPQTRFWELMLGSILAYISLYKQDTIKVWQNNYKNFSGKDTKAINDALSLLGAALIGAGMLIISRQLPFPGWWAVPPTLGTVMIISAGPHTWLNRAVLSSRALVWLGLISYPLYLWHWPLLSFARIIESQTPSSAIRFAAAFISVVLAWLTYRLIEKPIRFGNHGEAKTIILVALMVVVGYVGYNSYQRDGLGFRLKKEDEINSLLVKYPHEFSNEACANLFPLLKEFNAWLLSKPYKPSIAIVGDSHSNHFYKSLAKQLGNDSIINIGVWRCLPFSSQVLQSKNECIEKTDFTLRFLKDEETIKTVYLAGYWSYLESGSFDIDKEGRQAIPPTPGERLSFRRNAESFISNLISAKKEVILIRDIPDLNFDLKSCFDYRPVRITQKVRVPCGIDEAEYDRRIAIFDADLSEVLNKFPTLKVFDPKSIFCDSKFCWAVKNGESLYATSDHLSIYGADLVIKALLSKFPIR
jgi:peptidoglycan/LPS O-acetylase OafA/YrhL